MVDYFKLKISSNTQRVINGLRKDLRKLDKKSDEAVNKTVEIGKHVAFDLAPKETNKTAKAIKDFHKGDGRKRAVLIAGSGHPDKVWRGKKFNLTYWMHFSDKALSHPWRSGTPRFMDETQEYMIREFNQKINMAINAFVTGE